MDKVKVEKNSEQCSSNETFEDDIKIQKWFDKTMSKNLRSSHRNQKCESHVDLRRKSPSVFQRLKGIFVGKHHQTKHWSLQTYPPCFESGCMWSHHLSLKHSNSPHDNCNCHNRRRCSQEFIDNDGVLLFPSELLLRRSDCDSWWPPSSTLERYNVRSTSTFPRQPYSFRSSDASHIKHLSGNGIPFQSNVLRHSASPFCDYRSNRHVHNNVCRHSSVNVFDDNEKTESDYRVTDRRDVHRTYFNDFNNPQPIYSNADVEHRRWKFENRGRSLPLPKTNVEMHIGGPCSDDEIIFNLPHLNKLNSIQNSRRFPLPQRSTSSLSRRPDSCGSKVVCSRCQSVILPQPTSPKTDFVVNLSHVYLKPKKFTSFADELYKLSKHGWYWGPISRLEAEERLKDQPDGSFLVRDSSDDCLLLSLYVRSVGRTLFVRIEYGNGKFSLHSRDPSKWHSSVVSLIEYSMKVSHFRAVFYTKPQGINSLSYPIRLTRPISRFCEVRSLQYLCRFVIRYHTRMDLIHQLPLPTTLINYVEETCY